MVEPKLPDEASSFLIERILIIFAYFFGNMMLRRMQIIPSRLTALGLAKEYLLVFLFPMDPIRNIITQFVEIKLAKDRDSQLESALRAAYDGTGYWLDVTPRGRKIQTFEKKTVVGYGSQLRNLLLSPFYKGNTYLPINCMSVTKIKIEDIPLILRHKITTTQSRITKDTTIVTKACYLVFTLHWLYIIISYAYYFYTIQHLPREFRKSYFIPASIVVPLCYTFGKCISPVFVSLWSDEFYLRKDFIELVDHRGVSEEIVESQVSSMKKSIQKETRIRYALERAIGSLIYLFVHVSVKYAFTTMMNYGIEGTYPLPRRFEHTNKSPLIMFMRYSKLLEAVLHSANCLTKLVDAYYTSGKFIRVWNLWNSIMSAVYLLGRAIAAIF